jgi:hypothetical protein
LITIRLINGWINQGGEMGRVAGGAGDLPQQRP